jgi:hypothetical protein
MSLVNDNRKTVVAVFVANFLEDKWKLLDGRNDDLLSSLKKPSKIARVLGMAHDGAYLSKLFDRLFQLLIKNLAISDNDDRVKNVLFVFRYSVSGS